MKKILLFALISSLFSGVLDFFKEFENPNGRPFLLSFGLKLSENPSYYGGFGEVHEFNAMLPVTSFLTLKAGMKTETKSASKLSSSFIGGEWVIYGVENYHYTYEMRNHICHYISFGKIKK